MGISQETHAWCGRNYVSREQKRSFRISVYPEKIKTSQIEQMNTIFWFSWWCIPVNIMTGKSSWVLCFLQIKVETNAFSEFCDFFLIFCLCLLPAVIYSNLVWLYSLWIIFRRELFWTKTWSLTNPNERKKLSTVSHPELTDSWCLWRRKVQQRLKWSARQIFEKFQGFHKIG